MFILPVPENFHRCIGNNDSKAAKGLYNVVGSITENLVLRCDSRQSQAAVIKRNGAGWQRI